MTARPAFSPARLFLASAGVITLWLLATFLWHFTYGTGRQMQHILFLDQDFPALLFAIIGLILLSPFAWGNAPGLPAPTARIIVPLIVIFALWSWAGHYLLFQGYVLSRDEEVAQFAAAYLRDGLIARPIPPEWVPFRRAMMPEFFSPYGATHYWAAAYLPINSAIQAAFWRLGDASLAAPALVATGLFALWRVAMRLFPDRPDALWVVMLMALTSTQLSVTAMTPYAMTGHFALNMVWLALFLRGRVAGHIGAGIVAIIAAGLHQWHFPPIFLAPFLLWMLLQRRWGVLAFHTLVLLFLIWFWARYWPTFLLEHLGPAADVRPTGGVGDKVGSLFTRLTVKWQPLTNLSRLLAWNNVLLVPLSVLAVVGMRWRGVFRGESIVLPLAIGCIAGCVLALAQGYGWGFRYAHGFIGPLCLLAGFGWVRVGSSSLRPILIASALALCTGAFLSVRAHDYVVPYAASHRLIHASPADVVLVDARGGMFVTDLVRSEQGDIRVPIVMNLAMLDDARLDMLCARHRVALFDRHAFLPLGIRPVRWGSGYIAGLRAHLDAIGCGRVMTVPWRPGA